MYTQYMWDIYIYSSMYQQEGWYLLHCRTSVTISSTEQKQKTKLLSLQVFHFKLCHIRIWSEFMDTLAYLVCCILRILDYILSHKVKKIKHTENHNEWANCSAPLKTRGIWCVDIMFVFHYFRIKGQEYVPNIPVFFFKLTALL